MPIEISSEQPANRSTPSVQREKFEPFRSSIHDLQDLLSLRLFRTKTTSDSKVNEGREDSQIGESWGYYTDEEIKSARSNRNKVTSLKVTKDIKSVSNTNVDNAVPDVSILGSSNKEETAVPIPLMTQIISHKRIKKENTLREQMIQAQQRLKNSVSGKEISDTAGPSLDEKLDWILKHSHHSMNALQELLNVDKRIDSWRRFVIKRKNEVQSFEVGVDFTGLNDPLKDEIDVFFDGSHGKGSKKVDAGKMRNVDCEEIGNLNLKSRLNAMQHENTHYFVQNIMPIAPFGRNSVLRRGFPHQLSDASIALSEAKGICRLSPQFYFTYCLQSSYFPRFFPIFLDYALKPPRRPIAAKPSASFHRTMAKTTSSNVRHKLSSSSALQGHDEMQRTVEVVPLDGEDGALLHAKISRKHTEKEGDIQSSPDTISRRERFLEDLEKETIQYMEMDERLKKLMAIPARILRESEKEFNSLSTSVKEKIKVGKEGCQKLATHLAEFQDEIETRRSQLERECDYKDFVRQDVCKAKHDVLKKLGT